MPNDYRASQGWFSKFKRPYGISILKVYGEILSSHTSTITLFINALSTKMHQMEVTNERLFNAYYAPIQKGRTNLSHS